MSDGNRWAIVAEYHDGRLFMTKECRTREAAELAGSTLLQIHGSRDVRFYIVQIHFSTDN